MWHLYHTNWIHKHFLTTMLESVNKLHCVRVCKNLYIIHKATQNNSNTIPSMGRDLWKWSFNFVSFLNCLFSYFFSPYQNMKFRNNILVMLENVPQFMNRAWFFFLFFSIRLKNAMISVNISSIYWRHTYNFGFKNQYSSIIFWKFS